MFNQKMRRITITTKNKRGVLNGFQKGRLEVSLVYDVTRFNFLIADFSTQAILVRWRRDDITVRHIIDDLQKQYEIERQRRVAQKMRDDEMTEYAQTRWKYHKALGNKERADFYDWVLEIVDRLEEAKYENDELIEQVKQQDEYIEENIEPDNTWRDGWFNR